MRISVSCCTLCKCRWPILLLRYHIDLLRWVKIWRLSTSIHWTPYIKRRNFIPFLYISVQNAFNQKRLTIHYYRISPSAATQGYFSCLRVKWCQFLTPGEGVNYSSTTVLMLFYDAIYRSLSVSRKTILYLDVFIWLSAMSDEILI